MTLMTVTLMTGNVLLKFVKLIQNAASFFTSVSFEGLNIVSTIINVKNEIMRRLFISLMLTLAAFIANAQPSAIAPRDYQQMLKKGIDVDWWGRSEKNKYGLFGNGS